MVKKELAIGFVVLALGVVGASSAMAQATINNKWTGAGPDDLWTTPSNWSLGIAPVNAFTNPYAGWDDPSSPFYPLTPGTADDQPLGNNDAQLRTEGTRLLIDSTVDAQTFALRVGYGGASNMVEITGGHLQIGAIGLPQEESSSGWLGHFFDIGREWNMTSNPNPLAQVVMSGGTVDTNWILIPEQQADPSKANPYDTAPLNGELIMSGGTINTNYINLGQIVGNGRAELSGDATINLLQATYGPGESCSSDCGGFLEFNRGYFTQSGTPVVSIGEVNFDISENAVVNVFGNGLHDGPADGLELDRLQDYVDMGWLTANGGTAEPILTLEVIDDVPRITIRAPELAGLLGDYNGNEIIDAADYTVWRDALTAGATALLNDPTPGTVNESDFTYWRAHFGEMLGGGAGAAAAFATIPEPSTVLLLGTAALLGLAIFRRCN